MLRHASAHKTNSGQATLEYALVTGALLAVLLALGALFHACNEGVLVQYALDHASHRMHLEDDGTLSVLCY